MTKTYTTRSNAKRAAVAELGSDAMEGADYRLIETGGRWSWTFRNQPEPAPEPAAEDGFATARHRAGSKQAKLIEMLKRPQGAELAEIATTFGWRPCTVRGAIAGALKKKLGLDVVSEKIAGQRTYRIAG